MTKDDGDSFPLRIWSGLLTKKHWERMGQSIWLFAMLIDKVTVEKDGKGHVLGGKPITYADLADEMPISSRQYQRLMDTLREHKYISTTRTPSGLKIVINKSKKYGRPRSAINGDSPPPDKPIVTERSAGIGSSDKTDVADAYIDNTVDIKETEKALSILDFEKLWERLYKIFNLPKNSGTGYKSQLVETIDRLGIDIAIAATDKFLKITEDHPPSGKIKSITDFLHWKKIDLYVTMLPDLVEWRYYSCPVCVQTIKVDSTMVGPAMLELPSMICHKKQRVEVTDTVRECKKQKFSPEQVRVVLNKRFKK